MSKLQVLNETDFNNLIQNTDKPVVIDLFADWCAPCRMLAPAVEGLANDYAEKAVVAKVNVDENQNVAQQYNVMGIPTVLFFKNGKVADRVVGLVRQDELSNRLESIL